MTTYLTAKTLVDSLSAGSKDQLFEYVPKPQSVKFSSIYLSTCAVVQFDSDWNAIALYATAGRTVAEFLTDLKPFLEKNPDAFIIRANDASLIGSISTAVIVKPTAPADGQPAGDLSVLNVNKSLPNFAKTLNDGKLTVENRRSFIEDYAKKHLSWLRASCESIIYCIFDKNGNSKYTLTDFVEYPLLYEEKGWPDLFAKAFDCSNGNGHTLVIRDCQLDAETMLENFGPRKSKIEHLRPLFGKNVPKEPTEKKADTKPKRIADLIDVKEHTDCRDDPLEDLGEGRYRRVGGRMVYSKTPLGTVLIGVYDDYKKTIFAPDSYDIASAKLWGVQILEKY